MHEHQKWPDLTWSLHDISSELAEVRFKQGRLLGKMEGLGFTLKKEATLEVLTTDVVKSSAIEGEHLSSHEVRSSIARKLGIEIGGLTPSSRNVDGIVEMMLDATQNYNKPLTDDRLFGWHAALFPTGRSGWRTLDSGPMQVISGPIGKERIHFEAVPAEKISQEMNVFLNWFNHDSNEIDPILKAGVAHFWFLTIHPFEDGNGRIARAIGDLALARADGSTDRFYSLSSQIESEPQLTIKLQ